MQEKKIPHVFDIVISGDGTDILPKILKIARSEKIKNHTLQDVEKYRYTLKSAHGYFEAGYLDENNEIQYIYPEKYIPIDTTDFPSPYVAR